MQTSSIANLKRTDQTAFRPPPVGGGIVAPTQIASSLPGTQFQDNPENQHLLIRSIIAIVLMLSVWVSFHPFKSAQEETTGGDIVNQLGFGFLMIVCIVTLATLVDKKLLVGLIKPSYLALGVMLILSVLISSGIGASFRAMMFSVIVMMAALTVMTLPRNIEQFAKFIALGCLLTLAFSYFALLVYPQEAIHQAGGDEGQHAGLWRGVYDHKNVASAVMAVFTMVGIFAWREKHRLLGAAVTALAMLFLLNSGSKTSLALLPVAMFYTAFLAQIRSPISRFIFALAPLGILFTITVGSAVLQPINNILQTIAPGTNFTGRLDLWQFSVDQIAKYPFFGYGFENFWGTPAVTNSDQPIELTWDVREIVHGHNSYLDAAISFGLIGLGISILILILLPAADYAATQWQGPTARLANLLMSIWIFTSLNACLESFFFRRADPVWFCMLLAVFGLRLLATAQARNRP